MPKVSEEYRQEQRSRILAAARDEFARNGFRATTMPDIITAAGMSPGGVYRYFSGKEEIVAAIAADVARWFSATVADIVADVSPQDWPQAIRLLLRRIDEQEETIGRLALTVWGESQRDPAIAVIVGEEIRTLRGRVTGLIRTTQSGPGTPGDPDVMGQVVFSLLAGFLLQRRLVADVGVDQYADAVIDLLRQQPG